MGEQHSVISTTQAVLCGLSPVQVHLVCHAMGGAGKYEDALGLSLPPAAEPFCDAWKRAEELLQGSPNVPMVCLKAPSAADQAAAAATAADSKKGVVVQMH